MKGKTAVIIGVVLFLLSIGIFIFGILTGGDSPMIILVAIISLILGIGSIIFSLIGFVLTKNEGSLLFIVAMILFVLQAIIGFWLVLAIRNTP